MGMKIKAALAAVVVAGAGIAAYGWVRAGAEPRVLEVIATSEVRARIRRCGCQGEPDLSKAPIRPQVGTCSCRPLRSCWVRPIGRRKER